MQLAKLIEENRKWLEFYCGCAKFIGALLIFAGVLGTIATLYFSLVSDSQERSNTLFPAPWQSQKHFTLFGILLIAVSQFIGQFLDRERRQGIVLRYAHLFMWIWALGIGVEIVVKICEASAYFASLELPAGELTSLIAKSLVGTNVILPDMGILLI